MLVEEVHGETVGDLAGKTGRQGRQGSKKATKEMDGKEETRAMLLRSQHRI